MTDGWALRKHITARHVFKTHGGDALAGCIPVSLTSAAMFLAVYSIRRIVLCVAEPLTLQFIMGPNFDIVGRALEESICRGPRVLQTITILMLKRFNNRRSSCITLFIWWVLSLPMRL